MANPIVTSLPQYVEEHRLPLISEAVIGSKTSKLINLQTGIKDAAVVNRLNTDVVFGDGHDCGWDASGNSTLSQRKIQTGQIKINTTFCDKQLLGKWAEYEVRVAAGQKTLPFEEDFVNGVVNGIKAAVEKAVWQGDTSTAQTDPNLNKFDGLIKIANDSSVITYTYAAAATNYSILKAVYERIPTAVFSKYSDVAILCGTDMYRAFIQELVSANLYHYNPGAAGDEEGYMLPGTSVRVIGVPGLDNTGKVFGGSLSNLFYGCDLAGDEEKFEFWYSQDNREFRMAVEFNVGTQIAWPQETVYAYESAE